jgi:hypothetical protein
MIHPIRGNSTHQLHSISAAKTQNDTAMKPAEREWNARVWLDILN